MHIRRLFFLGFIFAVATGFFWDDEEKQLKQLYQTAESAFTTEKYEEAAKAYEEVLNKVDSMSWQKAHMDWRTYVDTVSRLSLAYNALGKYDDIDARLTKLLARRPPQEYLGPIKLLKARLTQRKGPQEQYADMKAVSAYLPQENWKKEDITFFQALEYSLNSQYDQMVHKAKRHQVAGSFTEAIALYNELLLAIAKGYYPKVQNDSFLTKKIRFHLAECHFAVRQYEQALQLCDKTKNECQIDREMIYLSALCFREKEEYEKALELFEHYSSSAKSKDLDHYDHALFEIGHFYYRKNQLERARNCFEKLLSLDEKKSKPSLLAAIYLAKMCLNENKPQEVTKLLQEVSNQFSSHDPLRVECYFLQGKAFFCLGNYIQAREYLEKCLSSNKSHGPLTRFASYYLGLTFLKLAENETKTAPIKEQYFDKAEEIFQKLMTGELWEEARLGLSRLYLSKHATLKIPTLELVHKLLVEKYDDFSLKSRLEALLLRAEAEECFEAKEAFYKTACGSSFETLPRYSEAVMLRGLNFFKEGLASGRQGHFFEEAARCFEKGFQKTEKSDRQKAAALLKLEAKTCFYRNLPVNALAAIERLLDQFDESSEEREETLYLKGLIASKLPDAAYLETAEKAFLQLVARYPDGKYMSQALYMLGTLYYNKKMFEKAHEAFLKVALGFPDSDLAPEALFWAAGAEEKLGLDPSEKRVQIYQKYPTHSKAAESYFRRYPCQSYLAKETSSISHLREFPLLFPDSPLLVCVHCLLGMNATYFEPAEHEFNDALSAFQRVIEKGETPHASLIYFRYRSLLELAQLYLAKEKKLDIAIALLKTINHEFSSDAHPFASLLKTNCIYPPLFEESEYTLGKVFLHLGQNAKALECFASMLKHYKEAGINKATFLSLLWREEGKLSMAAQDMDTALKCFEISEECGLGYLNDDQLLSLWILQSNCHKEKKEYDLAMRLLSKVINADVASTLRLEAMSLRADIYEQQNRPELALRQLEAAAKKGSLDAAEKLKRMCTK